jgi:PIN domain nuclease of toxin-antitoxin system
MGTIGFLLDTHAFLWVAKGSSKISEIVIRTIEDKDNPVFVSAVSAYEIMNKCRIGKLLEFEYVAKNYFNIVKALEVTTLPITEHHAYFAGEFEWSHRDPFDRLLAAQASIENLVLITNDPAFETLQWVKTLW